MKNTQFDYKQLWCKQEEFLYSTEVSRLDICTEKKMPRNLCPHCEKPFYKKHIYKIDRDEDIYGWNFKHDCGVELLIIND